MSSAALWPAISSEHQIDWLEQTGAQFEQVWLKCDTGMHRLGLCQMKLRLLDLASQRSALANIVLMSHFADAEAPDSALTQRQLLRWGQISDAAPAGSFSNSPQPQGKLHQTKAGYDLAIPCMEAPWLPCPTDTH